MYIAWINTITLGGKRHKEQPIVQEFSTEKFEKEHESQHMDCSHYLGLHLLQHVFDTLLSTAKDSQPWQ